jgi:hypothetical protein
MIWDLIQQRHISATHREAEAARHSAARAERSQENTADRVSRLALITQAVWELLKEHHHLDDTDLLAKIEEIDLRDGKADGKAGATAKTCLGCGRKLSTRFAQCVYCGCDNPHYSPFTGM